MELVAVALFQRVPADDVEALFCQLGQQFVLDELGLAGAQHLGAFGDAVEHLPRRQAGCGCAGDSRGDAPFEAGDADHVELVEVRREDRREPGAFQQRQRGVFGLFEDALVELHPRQFAVAVAAFRQRVLEAQRLDFAQVRQVGDGLEQGLVFAGVVVVLVLAVVVVAAGELFGCDLGGEQFVGGCRLEIRGRVFAGVRLRVFCGSHRWRTFPLTGVTSNLAGRRGRGGRLHAVLRRCG